ncbi:MAG: hypothetical protein NUV74_14470 [Candidatus Brocadiaceae bacterium]|nr:hypothetical protein [Candidatus Brocadiaceae bacterium]
MFKGYISNTIGRVQWTIHARSSFLIPYLERISDGISKKSTETTDDTLLTIMRKDRYKILGAFEVFHANEVQIYLVKMYKYSGLIQKVKQVFKNTRGFREFNTTCVAAMKGVPVEVPVAYGERKHLFAKESYLIIRKIKAVTVYIQKKDAKKFYKQCIQENRKFGLFKNTNYYGHFRRDYSPETLLLLLDTLGEPTQEVCYINNFQIVHFTGHARAGRNYRNIKQVWRHANAVFALSIDVPIPVGIFTRHSAKLPREGFLLSQMTENCVPLDQYAEFPYSDEGKTCWMLSGELRCISYKSSSSTKE